MKNGKRPTKAQKKILAFYGFHPEDWLISKNTSTELVILHRTYQTYPEASGYRNHIIPLRGETLLSPNAAKDGDKPVKMQSRQSIYNSLQTEVFLMAKAKLTLKQEADMLSAVNQIKELEAAGKQLKKQADELRSQVKAMMDKKHLEEMDVGNFTVRYTTVVSSRFDSRAFQETHQALYDQYCVASESKRFTIS